MTTSLLVAGTDRPRASADLLHIVRINEEIKVVVRVAAKINIMALNAIFLAKRAGTAALGFGVLSNELRVFSGDLRACMSALNGRIYGCVNEVSLALRDLRHTRLIRQAVMLSGKPGPRVILARCEAENEEHARRLERLRNQLKSAFEEASQMVELGGALAKSAKIEAAYGQGFAAELAQVSSEFDGVVGDIRTSLELLRRSAFFSAY